MVAKANASSTRRAPVRRVVPPRTAGEWERGWRRTWRRLGFVPYELPPDDSPEGQEREFLAHSRTAEGERERHRRIQEEFERGFRALAHLGPAVTVFGSARFKEGHRYYELAREVGCELARMARSLLRGDDERRRLTRIVDRDIEHCFWRHGHAAVFERLAGLAAGPGGATPRRVIDKAIERHSKPGVAFELLASVATPGAAGAPPPLRQAIETCVALARRGARAASREGGAA